MNRVKLDNIAFSSVALMIEREAYGKSIYSKQCMSGKLYKAMKRNAIIIVCRYNAKTIGIYICLLDGETVVWGNRKKGF